MARSDTAPDGSILDLFDSDLDHAVPPTSPSGPGGGGPGPGRPVDDDARRRRRKILALILALVMLVAGAVIGWYLLNRKPLTELPGTRVVDMPTYKTSIYGLEAPLGVAVAPDGSTIYASHGGATAGVKVFNRDGREVRSLEFPADEPYHVPVYLTVAPNGNLYVGDRAAGEVYLFTPEGDYIERFIPQDSAITFSPLGVAVAEDGTLYIADVASEEPKDHRILVFDANGLLLDTWGEGELNYPNQLFLEGGSLYATDGNNGRLVVFDAEGTRSTLV